MPYTGSDGHRGRKSRVRSSFVPSRLIGSTATARWLENYLPVRAQTALKKKGSLNFTVKHFRISTNLPFLFRFRLLTVSKVYVSQNLEIFNKLTFSRPNFQQSTLSGSGKINKMESRKQRSSLIIWLLFFQSSEPN